MNEIIELGTIQKLSKSLMISNQAIQSSNEILKTLCLSIQQLMENETKQNIMIEKIENKINDIYDDYQTVVENIFTWDAQKGVNKIVRTIAHVAFKGKYYKAWDKIYGEMLYKYGIGIKQRISLYKPKNKSERVTIFTVIDDNEMKLLVKTCLSLCKMYEIDIKELMAGNKKEDQDNVASDIVTNGFIKYVRN